MLAFSGVLAVAGGLLVFAWYRTVAALPASRRPSFIRGAFCKWALPVLGLAGFAAGLLLLRTVDVRLALGVAGAAILLLVLVIKFDRYSATARLINDRYQTLRLDRPDLDHAEALFQTARWRYPHWSEERVLQFIAGKDIAELILLIVISENGINPLADWELYRSVKRKVSCIAGGKGV